MLVAYSSPERIQIVDPTKGSVYNYRIHIDIEIQEVDPTKGSVYNCRIHIGAEI